LARAAAGAEANLRAFLDRLRDWAGEVDAPPDQLTIAFAKAFRIGG
jgi:hypothetical protein